MDTARRAAPFLSLILPTRQRPEGLTRFLASIAATATSLDTYTVGSGETLWSIAANA